MPKPFFENLFSELSSETEAALNSYDSIIKSVCPLSARQEKQLPHDILSLAHNLTDKRSGRRTGYLNDPTSITAYIWYYHWWNLVRLTRIFTPLAQNFSVPENGVCVDIGSGPLTVVSALYLSCPHLRAKNITWYCVDQSRAIMEKGEDLFFALCARMIAAHNTKTQTHTQATAQTEPFGEWRIVRVQGRAGVALRKKAHLVVAANVFNEIIEQTRLPLEKTAAREAANLLSYANDDATLVALEPGTPKPARFLSVLREYLISKNAVPFSPCLHSARCPMDGKKGGKWCHFSFDVNAAPERLLKLSRDAKLPKEKAALSFIAVRQNSLAVPQKESGIMPVRIASEAIKLPQDGRTGFYGCAHTGLVLAIARTRHPASGDVVNVQIPQNPVFDKKSGALITAIL